MNEGLNKYSFVDMAMQIIYRVSSVIRQTSFPSRAIPKI